MAKTLDVISRRGGHGEIRLDSQSATGNQTRFAAEEYLTWSAAKRQADPRYGNDPAGAMEKLRQAGFILHGSLL